MGLAISSFFQNLFNKQARISMIGLEGGGKTTILYKLKLNEVITSIPTIGFNVETVRFKNIVFTIWDVSAHSKKLWTNSFSEDPNLIFVVDSSDRDQLEESKQVLQSVMENYLLHSALLLVFANKEDLPGSMDVNEITQILNLNAIRQKWHIQATCAKTGTGLYEGLEWLSSQLS